LWILVAVVAIVAIVAAFVVIRMQQRSGTIIAARPSSAADPGARGEP
jgi:hypothetical protein